MPQLMLGCPCAFRGLPPDDIAALLSTYTMGVPTYLQPPGLNPEVALVIPDHIRARDAYSQEDQTTLGAALSALGRSLSLLLEADEEVDKEEVVHHLADSGKILTHLLHKISLSRRNVILPKISDKTAKDVLTDTNPDTLLFGADLGLRLKTSKEVATTSKALLQPPKPASSSSSKLRFRASGNGRGLQRRFSSLQANRTSAPPRRYSGRRQQSTKPHKDYKGSLPETQPRRQH